MEVKNCKSCNKLIRYPGFGPELCPECRMKAVPEKSELLCKRCGKEISYGKLCGKCRMILAYEFRQAGGKNDTNKKNGLPEIMQNHLLRRAN